LFLEGVRSERANGETVVVTHGPVDPSDDQGAVTRVLIRADPPAEAMNWVRTLTGAQAVSSVKAMPGGSSVAMHRVTLVVDDHRSRQLILRRYVRPEQLAEDPGVAAHEAIVLDLVADMATPAPRLVGCDPTGDVAGAPAVLMTALTGRPVWAANPAWMRQLIEVLADIHAVDASAVAVRPFQPYPQVSYKLPRWVTKPAVWERAIELFHGPVIDEDRAFIHRDFYPGNVLWSHRRVSGVVDWEAASIGPRSMDVAHCRINLLYADMYQAERFRQQWEAISGHTFHPWADIATIIGLLDSHRRHPPAHRARHDIETMLERAVSDLTSQ
jgi:aminoglycoside phosphotransferase (APT) family kinase protein